MGDGSELSCVTTQKDDVVIVALTGAIDCTHSNILSGVLAKTREQQHPKRIILDMSRVNYVDSSGLGILVAERSRSVKARIDFRLCGLAGAVLGVFRMAHLDRLFELYDSTDQAMED